MAWSALAFRIPSSWLFKQANMGRFAEASAGIRLVAEYPDYPFFEASSVFILTPVRTRTRERV